MSRVQKYAWLIIIALILAMIEGAYAEKIKLVYMDNVSAVTSNVDAELIKMFESEHPNIEVEFMNIPSLGEYFEKIPIMAAAGTLPDVIMVHSHNFYSVSNLDILMPLNDMMERDDSMDASDIVPKGLEEFTVGGSHYAIPYVTAIVAALYYNKDAFAESGLPLPPKDWPWDAFVKDVKKLTKMDGDEIARWPLYTYHPNNWVHSWGGALVDDWRNPTDTLIDTPEALAGYQTFVSLFTDLALCPPPAVRSGWGGGYAKWFASGRIAMVYTGLWASWGIGDTSFDWDITLPPLGEGPGGGRGYEFVQRGYAVNAASEHPQEAYELAKFLSYNEEAIKTRFLSQAGSGFQGEMPSRISAARGEAFAANDLRPASKSLLIDVYDDVFLMPRHAQASTMFGIAASVAWDAISGKNSVSNLAESAAERIRAMLRGK